MHQRAGLHPALAGLERPSLFWDVRPEDIDPAKHQRWIIARVLECGTWEEIRVLFRLYSVHTIRDAVAASRTLRARSHDLWLALLVEEVAVFHTETLSVAAWQLLDQRGGLLGQPGFMLCGGTAVALRLGHRRSVDLDLFTGEDFDARALWDRLSSHITGALLLESGRNTLHATLAGVDVSFIKQVGVKLDARGDLAGVPIADLDTLAVLKLNAATGRGARKDFIDLYALCQNGWTLPALMDALQRRAPALDPSAALRSLTYFADAEGEPMPEMLTSWAWEDVKRFFQAHVRTYVAGELGIDR